MFTKTALTNELYSNYSITSFIVIRLGQIVSVPLLILINVTTLLNIAEAKEHAPVV